MTKQGYIEWRRGAAAYKAGEAFSLKNSHEWKMGYLIAEIKVRDERAQAAA